MAEIVKTVIECYFLLPDFWFRGHPYKKYKVLNVPTDVERVDTVDVERDGPMNMETSNSKG